jgi:glycosyltransferase involved in cell wall biosynthesis
MRDRPLIVNATAIGSGVDGIAVYGVNLVKALWRSTIDRPFTVVLSQDARRFFPDSEIPSGARIRWVSDGMSPSRGTPGNIRRWLFANQLALLAPGALVLGLSQLEAAVAGRGIVMVHDLIPALFPEAHPRQSYFYRHYLGRALRHAAAIVTPSDTTKDDVCGHYGIDRERVHVIPHGSPVPLSDPDSAGTERDRFILWLGRPDPTKNLPAMLAAFRMLERQLDVRLVIAGYGSDVGLRAGESGPGTDGRITTLGAVAEAEKIALLDRASALVCSSLYEGFGFTPLEAMARGCPVVTTRVGAVAEVCADAALYVDPRQPEQIAEALRRVITRPELSRRLAERGRRRAGAFTWETSVRDHLAVVDRVMRHDLPGRLALASGRDRPIRADVLP